VPNLLTRAVSHCHTPAAAAVHAGLGGGGPASWESCLPDRKKRPSAEHPQNPANRPSSAQLEAHVVSTAPYLHDIGLEGLVGARGAVGGAVAPIMDGPASSLEDPLRGPVQLALCQLLATLTSQWILRRLGGVQEPHAPGRRRGRLQAGSSDAGPAPAPRAWAKPHSSVQPHKPAQPPGAPLPWSSRWAWRGEGGGEGERAGRRRRGRRAWRGDSGGGPAPSPLQHSPAPPDSERPDKGQPPPPPAPASTSAPPPRPRTPPNAPTSALPSFPALPALPLSLLASLTEAVGGWARGVVAGPVAGLRGLNKAATVGGVWVGRVGWACV
jgi:hypothetical protein